MDKLHYTRLKLFTIYALTLHAEVPYVYIGKTASLRLAAVCSRHICGTVKATEGYFTKDNRPNFYILEHFEASTAEAYRHVLAWLRIFQDNGYFSINHERTIDQSQFLLPETNSILKQLQQEPFSLMLKRTYVARPTDANFPSPEKRTIHEEAEQPKEIVQMNVRMDRQDKDRFDAFCKKNKLNQREGFSILLDSLSQDSAHLLSLSAKQKEKIIELQEENNRLKEKLSIASGKLPHPKETQAQALLHFLQQGIRDYLHLLFPDIASGKSLKVSSYRKFMRRLPVGITYTYPEKGGFLLLSLEAILWGKSPRRACFLVGRDEDGRCYKLRYYPRDTFFGIPFLDSPYAFPGAKWYIGFQQAPDGAMEISAALPLSALPDYLSQTLPAPPMQDTPVARKPDLDHQIHNASLRSK